MKKLVLVAGILLLLTGCAAEPTFETLSDEYVQPVLAQTHQIALTLPNDAAALTVQSDEGGDLYFCDGYTITVQVLQSGDLNKTLRHTTGFEKEDLQLMQTQTDGNKRYDWVWTAAGEGEDQVCRGAILDDGVSHYVLTCMAGASQAQQVQEDWQDLFSSFCLLTQEDLIRTGS